MENKTIKKKRTKIITLSVIGITLVLLIVWVAWGNNALELNSYSIASNSLPKEFDGFRIAHVSDLHNAEMGKDNEKLISMLADAEPDIIVTQEYHLYRALYIAEKLGIEAYGVNADFHTYWGQSSRELREILARCKDFANTIIKPEPTYLGETIPVSGDGDITNDK